MSIAISEVQTVPKSTSTEFSEAQIKYNETHRKQARSVLRKIEKKHGKLSSGIITTCDEYAYEVLGAKEFSPWLYVYTAIAGEFKEGWIPDNFYGMKVVRALKGKYGQIAKLKSLNGTILKTDSSTHLASYINGLFFDNQFSVISPNDIRDYLFDRSDKIVFKVDVSSQGKGIYFFDKETFDFDKIKDLGNGIIESFIIQHTMFTDFTSSNCVATLRITSVVDDDGRVSARASYLRLGVDSDTHVQARSNIRIPVDVNTGRFGSEGYLPSWETTEYHPTSGKKFVGNTIPDFDKCLDFVKSLHNKIPYIRVVGWDVVIDIHGNIILIEWNGGHNDIKFSESVCGPCFSDLNWERFR